jgi:DNA polymerase III subunit beta
LEEDERGGDLVKFRCERDVLVNVLATVGRAVTGRAGALPVLSGARLELRGDELVATGSDLDLTVRATVTVNGQADGVAVVPARLAADIVRALEPGAVEVDVSDDEARISSGRSQFAVRVFAADEFPILPEPDAEPLRLPAQDFADGLRQVVPAASSDDARPILTGVQLSAEDDGLRLVATDSYRLAVRDLPGANVLSAGTTVLVPSRALDELRRLLGDAEEVELRLGEREVLFTVGDVRVGTRLIEGDFPNYRQLIPSEHPNHLTVGREPLLEAVRRVRLLAREATPLRVGQSADGLELSAITQDVGQAHETLDAKFEGTDLTVAFNPEYLLDGLEAATGDEVVFETRDALKPVLLRSAQDPDFLYLLMPVRVS